MFVGTIIGNFECLTCVFVCILIYVSIYFFAVCACLCTCLTLLTVLLKGRLSFAFYETNFELNLDDFFLVSSITVLLFEVTQTVYSHIYLHIYTHAHTEIRAVDVNVIITC